MNSTLTVFSGAPDALCEQSEERGSAYALSVRFTHCPALQGSLQHWYHQDCHHALTAQGCVQQPGSLLFATSCFLRLNGRYGFWGSELLDLCPLNALFVLLIAALI